MKNLLISALLFLAAGLHLLLVKTAFKGWVYVNWYDESSVIFMLLILSPAITLWGLATLSLYKALRDFCRWVHTMLHAMLDRALTLMGEIEHPYL